MPHRTQVEKKLEKVSAIAASTLTLDCDRIQKIVPAPMMPDINAPVAISMPNRRSGQRPIVR